MESTDQTIEKNYYQIIPKIGPNEIIMCKKFDAELSNKKDNAKDKILGLKN